MMAVSAHLETVAATLLEHDGFAIVGHSDPDGDSLGSSLGLGLALRQMGKRVAMLSADPLSAAYLRLPHSEEVVVSKTLPSAADYPVAVLMECNGLERTGMSGFDRRLVVNIDHHANNPDFGDVNWVDPKVAATSVMIFWLLQSMGVEITPAIATHLYVAILTDTGSFRYSNTDATAFAVASQLLEAGVDAAAVAEAIYENVPIAKVRLTAAGLSSLTLEPGGKVAWMALDHEVLHADPGRPDTEGIVNRAQAIEGVSVSILFKEVEPGSFRVSLRSDGSVDVARVAGNFGGGGHPRAAGCLVGGDLHAVRGQILEAIAACGAEPVNGT